MSDSPKRSFRRRIKPASWPVRCKYYLNGAWEGLFGKRLFKLSPYDVYGEAPQSQRKLSQFWAAFDDTNFPYAIGLLIFCIFALTAWHHFAPNSFTNIWTDILGAFVGLTLDVFFILIVFALFEHQRQKKQAITAQEEIIDDFKKWNSDEAKFRIAGAIRRLNRFGKTNIDFVGIELRDFSFRRHDIKSIQGSTFYDGTWGEMGSRDSMNLENVDFSHLDCRRVIFSKFNPIGFLDICFASIKDCCFIESDLSGAIFNGAHLEWTTQHPDDIGEEVENPDGSYGFMQTHYPPFSQANLSTTSFIGAHFKNADFREADGILECDFAGAKGLETCLFGDENTKNLVLQKAGNAA